MDTKHSPEITAQALDTQSEELCAIACYVRDGRYDTARDVLISAIAILSAELSEINSNWAE